MARPPHKDVNLAKASSVHMYFNAGPDGIEQEPYGIVINYKNGGMVFISHEQFLELQGNTDQARLEPEVLSEQ